MNSIPVGVVTPTPLAPTLGDAGTGKREGEL